MKILSMITGIANATQLQSASVLAGFLEIGPPLSDLGAASVAVIHSREATFPQR